MPKLNEVFGISNDVPEYTYVDRANLDEKFKYLLNTQRHLIIHGASKQGKTVLRRKNLNEASTISIQCHSTTNVQDMYAEIIRKIRNGSPKDERANKTLKGILGNAENVIIGTVTVENAARNVAELAEEIMLIRKRIVIEDFHYLPESEKKSFALDLKAFWDLGVFFVIVGIWAEQNLLCSYNGDLSGRIEDIDVAWSDIELERVLGNGENALNVAFESNIRNQMRIDANGNVGLVQRLAEKYCLECSVFETSIEPIILDDITALNRCRQAICSQESQRYRQFSDAVSRGFEESDLKVYFHIVRVAIEASDEELMRGLNRKIILERVNRYEAKARLSDLSAALNRLNRLQQNRSISPLVISFNPESRKLLLVDRELLFYRKYGNPLWPWQEGYTNSPQDD